MSATTTRAGASEPCDRNMMAYRRTAKVVPKATTATTTGTTAKWRIIRDTPLGSVIRLPALRMTDSPLKDTGRRWRGRPVVLDGVIPVPGLVLFGSGS